MTQPPPVAGNRFIAAVHRPDKNWLKEYLRAYALSKLPDAVRVNCFPVSINWRINGGKIQFNDLIGHGFFTSFKYIIIKVKPKSTPVSFSDDPHGWPFSKERDYFFALLCQKMYIIT